MKDFLKKLFHLHTWIDDGKPYIAGGRYDTFVDQSCSACSARRAHFIRSHEHRYSKWSSIGSEIFEQRVCLTCGVTEIRKMLIDYL